MRAKETTGCVCLIGRVLNMRERTYRATPTRCPSVDIARDERKTQSSPALGTCFRGLRQRTQSGKRVTAEDNTKADGSESDSSDPRSTSAAALILLVAAAFPASSVSEHA
ncbi:hypothetical protein ANO11243_020210 [Dothideomycetidae sp. 11243]|nr:hypothetical protein ANO11243_020210 [fungal sp. No.11243]